MTDAFSPAASNDSAATRARRNSACSTAASPLAPSIRIANSSPPKVDDRVFTLKFAADGAENLIADIMPVGIVDALEMIDVEHDRGKR